MNIQLFAENDLIKNFYDNANAAKQEMVDLQNEKTELLNQSDINYNNQLQQYNDLANQQQTYIDTWANTQKENQQKQTDYNIGLIEQNKKEAEKQTDKELGDAYVDYQKGLNQFGGSYETLLSNGLSGTGFAKNQEIAMNVTYQNRVSSAKASLMKANTDYDNQIQQALLNNDASLAEIALQQMAKSYDLALEGFNFRNNLYNNKLSYDQGIRDTYFNREQSLQNRIDTYNETIANLNNIDREFEEKKKENQRQYELELAKLNEDKRQFNLQYNTTFGNPYEDNENYPLVTQYYKGNYNTDAMTNGKVDKSKVFSNGYQPNNVNGNKLSSSGATVGQIFGSGNYGLTGALLDNQTVWTTNNKFYIWDGSQNKYIDVTSDVKSNVDNIVKTIAKK